MVRVRLIGADGKLTAPQETPKVILTDAQWLKKLTTQQYVVLRSKGTERPFCGGLLKNKHDGLYVCAGCDLPLFESKAKFESGTGWPSFFQSVGRENVAELPDRSHGMERIEINCARCDGHLGHVFEDGPEPTGRRYCLNSEALRFVEETDRPGLAQGAPASGPTAAPARAEVVFAGGCFWCVEGVFEEIDGVIEAESGYAGGDAATANYDAVCTGETGHAEAVRIVFDPSKVSLEKLLQVHFATHDPTTPNRQGNDHGSQYRSAIFYKSDEEKQIAQAMIDDLTDGKVFDQPIVTTLEPLRKFYPAEAYHQNYVCNNPNQSYVRAIALPKVEKVRKKFKEMLKPGSDAGAAK